MPYDISYEYDAAGNRTRKVDNLTAVVTTYTYDVANQLQTEQTATGTTSYTFDRSGNMETITTPSSDVTTYVWDAENRRTAVQTSGGSVEAAYNADGLRVRNGDTRFLWDGQAYLSEANSVSGESTLYTVQPSRYGRLISEKRSAAMNSEWFHFDALGSTVNVSDHNETVPERYIYDAWGNLLSSNSFRPRLLYIGAHGYYFNGSNDGRYHARARGYAPQQSRFLSHDPLSSGALYLYCGNNPTSRIDPSGLVYLSTYSAKSASGTSYCFGRPWAGQVQYVTGRGQHNATVEMKRYNEPNTLQSDVLISWDVSPKESWRGAYIWNTDEARWAKGHDCCCCNYVAWVQIVRSQSSNLLVNTGEGWHHDAPAEDLMKYAIIPLPEPGYVFTESGTSNRKGLPYFPKVLEEGSLPTQDFPINPCTHHRYLRPSPRIRGNPGSIMTLQDQPGIGHFMIGDVPLHITWTFPRVWFQDFETCAVCITGQEGIRWSSENPGATVYGCVRWGHLFVASDDGTVGGYYVLRWVDKGNQQEMAFGGNQTPGAPALRVQAPMDPPSDAFQRVLLETIAG